MTTAQDILTTWLREHGCDGVCNPDWECGCGLDDLIPCCDWFGECQPARKTTNDNGETVYVLAEEETT